MKEVRCKIELIPGGQVPWKKHGTDACWDLFARKIEKISEGKYKVWLGVKLQPEPGFRVALYPRSGLSKTMWILSNCVGIGDNGYTGEYIAVFDCIPVIKSNQGPTRKYISAISTEDFPYTVGDRVIQIEFVPYVGVKWDVVENLNSTKRGLGGFGSTGK